MEYFQPPEAKKELSEESLFMQAVMQGVSEIDSGQSISLDDVKTILNLK